MLTQICLVLTLAASSAFAGIVQPALAIARQAVQVDEPFDPYPRYDYSYAIRDAVTGDAKTQRESRDGQNVRGEYSIVEPDGTLRTVTYTAGIEGFNAVVNRQTGFAPPAPVFVRKQPLVYAPPQIHLTPAASVAHATIARPLAVRKRVVYKTRPGQISFPVFQNQLIGSFPQHIVQNPISFVQRPVLPVQQQVVVPVQHQQQVIVPAQPQPQPEIIAQEQPQPTPVQPAPIPVQPQPQPQPQPIPAEPQPQPPQHIPAFPQPQPQPAPAQPQPPPQQIPAFPQPAPQPQPQPQPAFPRPVQQQQNDDFDTVEVEAAPRSAANSNARRANAAGPALDGSSSFTYTSRGNQYDFSVAY